MLGGISVRTGILGRENRPYESVLVLEAVWQEAVEDHLGAAGCPVTPLSSE